MLASGFFLFNYIRINYYKHQSSNFVPACLAEFMSSPAGKLYTTIISVVAMVNGAKVIFKSIYELGKGISLAYGVNATTGQPVYALVQADGLVISDVVSSVSSGVAQAITGVAVSAFDSSLLGANGTQTTSNTLWQNGRTERIDVENPKPGQRAGEVHYHEPNNTKWRYDPELEKFVHPKTRQPAPKKIQKILKDPKYKKL